MDGGLPNTSEWENAKWRRLKGGMFEAGNGDNRTKRVFGDCRLHVEFQIPYQPGNWRDRGNSGVYLQDRYEVQVLESFGWEPDPGICGAIYRVSAPRENASLPPLAWQTFDITFTAPRMGRDGAQVSPARISVVHNGVPIQQDVPVYGQTGGGPDGVVEKGPIRLQDHGHPVRFRNIWLVESAAKGD
jgi:hypothetical protein